MRLRYSFKLLLIVFTLVVVCVGVFAVRLAGARRQRETVAALRAAEVSVWYEYQTWNDWPVMNVPDPLTENPMFAYSDQWKVWLGRRFGRDFVFDVSHVYKGSPMPAELVARLPQLRGLKHLQINVGEGFDDEAWQALLRCGQIERLTLERAHFEPTRRLAGLAELDQLEELEIKHGELTVEDAREMAGLANLKELTLSFVSVTDDSLQPLQQLKNLETLKLTHRGLGKEVSSGRLAFLADLPRLQTLDLARVASLDDGVFAHLEKVTTLTSLNLDQAVITGAEFQRLNRLPELRELNLIGTKVDDAAMEKVARLTGLASLDVSYTRVTDAGLAHVAALANLRNLNVSGNSITDAGLAEISRLLELEELTLGKSAVTDAGLAHLQKLPKLRSLWINGSSKITPAGLATLMAALPQLMVYQ